MGWDSSNLLIGTSIICNIKPSNENITNLLKTNTNSYCFFSGIRADTDVFHWFKMSLSYNVKDTLLQNLLLHITNLYGCIIYVFIY